MADLLARLAPRIASSEPCWFPGLADTLVADFWSQPQRVARAAYSTAAWLGLSSPPSAPVPGWRGIRLEPLPHPLAGRFAPSSVPALTALAEIASALNWLRHGNALGAVAPLIHSVHTIAAHGPGYDCSHSEPNFPFSVLVSIPCGERDAALRLAESLLHEAMHLQLSVIERHMAIVGNQADTAFSPWQQRMRPVQGLLHGLYVFAAIDDWLAAVDSARDLDEGERRYVARRRGEIGGEVAAVAALPASPALTGFGRDLATALLARFPATRIASAATI